MQTNEKLYNMSSTAEATGNRVQEVLEKGKQNLSELGQTLMNTSKDYARVTDQYVHDNSWKAAGIAAALGLIVGLLLHRR